MQTQSNKYIQSTEIAVQSKGVICVLLYLTDDFSSHVSLCQCRSAAVPSLTASLCAGDCTDVDKLDKR